MKLTVKQLRKIIHETVKSTSKNGKTRIMENKNIALDGGNMKVKFASISADVFQKKYTEAFESLEEIESQQGPFGVVKVPGHGKRPCVLQNDVPKYFWDEDDGWQEVPNVEFVKVDSV